MPHDSERARKEQETELRRKASMLNQNTPTPAATSAKKPGLFPQANQQNSLADAYSAMLRSNR